MESVILALTLCNVVLLAVLILLFRRGKLSADQSNAQAISEIADSLNKHYATTQTVLLASGLVRDPRKRAPAPPPGEETVEGEGLSEEEREIVRAARKARLYADARRVKG